jgi:hypothetical protein
MSWIRNTVLHENLLCLFEGEGGGGQDVGGVARAPGRGGG